MMRYRNHLLAAIALVVLAAGSVIVYSIMSPLMVFGADGPSGALMDPNSGAGRVASELSACAMQQKDLFKWVEAYHEKHGVPPKDLGTLIEDDMRCMYCTHCDLDVPFTLYPENYGTANAVFIAHPDARHSSALLLWLKGVKPSPQTMGDGTIHLFEGGKLITMDAKS